MINSNVNGSECLNCSTKFWMTACRDQLDHRDLNSKKIAPFTSELNPCLTGGDILFIFIFTLQLEGRTIVALKRYMCNKLPLTAYWFRHFCFA